ncbi:LysE family translocator [Sinobaca sp. H24]|uniref:LysE family translocator n=1 Tax=Sinobaca sp. H24 TaxID=2923376 RepID=UPI002079E496|nr:LysE family transporter [Sinobaca sp. H24]
MENLPAYILMAAMMSMLPGADTVLIMKNTLSHGAKAGRFTILGMATGLTFWTIIAVLGLSVVISQSPVLFETIKYMGAAYLFYLGVRSFTTKSSFSFKEVQKSADETAAAGSKGHSRDSYLQGVLSNILNPKTVVVYITFMPPFVDMSGNVPQQLMVLGGILTVIAVTWFLVLVFVLGHVQRWLNSPRFQQIFQKSTGLALMAFGAKLIF